MRVMADHIRAICFTIADGQLPSNNGAGYVIRRILRRAVRYQYQFLDIKEPFLCKLAEIIADSFKTVFPELYTQKDFVVKVIKEEEVSFLRTLENGMRRVYNEFSKLKAQLDRKARVGILPSEYPEKYTEIEENEKSILQNGEMTLAGYVAFELFDTFGFPLDLTELVAREEGWPVDLDGFNELLQEQKARSRKATELTTDDWVVIGEETPTVFLGYDQTEAEVKIIKYRKVKAKGKESYQLVFNQTPFYPEGGGQVGDTGEIRNPNFEIRIVDTKKENNLIIHFTEQLPENLEGVFTATVDQNKRKLTESNHSATHLLHAALRSVLGTHVQQKGSLVNNEYLRFDFSHFAAMTAEEIAKVEHIVNQKVRENIALDERRNVPIEEAKTLGAMMLFGEKYGESVRVITFDDKYSRELCGGTHVKATGQIGYFKLTSESAVAAGVRRIEAITADAAEQYVDGLQSTVTGINNLLKSKDLVKSVEQLLEEKTELLKKLEVFENEKTVQIKEILKSEIRNTKGVNILISRVDISNADQLKNLSFQLKNEIENLFCVLGCELNGKPMLSVIISDNLVADKKLHAGNIVKDLAKEIQGGGGGQPFYATAGGNNLGGLQAALDKAQTIIA
jgi:alanyl-tRNA synthetase